jgi:hypothetical protein
VDEDMNNNLDMMYTGFSYDESSRQMVANSLYRFPLKLEAAQGVFTETNRATESVACNTTRGESSENFEYRGCRLESSHLDYRDLNPDYIDLRHIFRVPHIGEPITIKPSNKNDVVDLSKDEFARTIALASCTLANSDNRCPQYIYAGLTDETFTKKKPRVIIRKICYQNADPSARKNQDTSCDKCEIDHYQGLPDQTDCIKCERGTNAPIGQKQCRKIANKKCPETSLESILQQFCKNDQPVANEECIRDSGVKDNIAKCDQGIFPNSNTSDVVYPDRSLVEKVCVEDNLERVPPRFIGTDAFDYFDNHIFKWQGDVRKQPDWRKSSFVAANVSETEFWNYLPGTVVEGSADSNGQDTYTVSDGGQYMGDPGGRRRLRRGANGRRLRELYTKNRITDWCKVAVETWTNECYLAAVESCKETECLERPCASNLQSIAQVSHIYNHESPLVPFIPHNDTPGGAPEGEPQPWDLYGKGAPPRWFLIEWDKPTFIKGTLLYYQIEITYNHINGERGDFDTRLPESIIRVGPECATIGSDGFLNPPCHLIANVSRPPHLQMYFFRIIAVVDYFDGKERIYARATPDEYRKNQRWVTAVDCNPADANDWIGIKGMYLETRRKPWGANMWVHKYSKDRLSRQLLYDEGFCAAADCLDSGVKSLCMSCCLSWATPKRLECLNEKKKFREDGTQVQTCIDSALCTESDRNDCNCEIREMDVPDFKLVKEHAYRFEEDLQDPFLWRCEPCPAGADCRSCARTTRPEPTSSELSRCLDTPDFPDAAGAARAWWELRALFGWWRPTNSFQEMYWTGADIDITDPSSYPTRLMSSLNSTPGRTFEMGNRSDKDTSIYPYAGTYAANRHPFGGGLKFYRCPYRQACLGSENPPEAERYYMNGTKNLANFQLTERCIGELGHTGVACSICMKGSHFMTLTGCDTCEAIDGGSVGVKLTVIFTVLFGVGFLIFKFRSLAVVAKDVSRTGKVLVNFIQVMGAIKDVYTLEIPSMNVGFNFGAYFKMFNFDLIEMFGIPCLIDMTYYERYVGDMSVIIGLIVFVFLIYVIIFFILKARDSNGGKERRARGKLKGIMESTKRQKAALEMRLEELEDVDTDSDEEEEGGGGKKGNGGASKVLGMFGAKAGPGGKISGLNRWTGLKKGLFSVRSFRKQKMTAQIRLKAICIAAAYYVLLFQHQPASVKTFNMFKCQKIEDTYFLRPDFRLTCFPLNGYHAFAGVIMAVFVFGFPAGTFYALYKKRNHLADPITMAQIGFLYFPYRPHAYWWETKNIMHKMLLTAGLVLLYQSAIVQCALAFAISVMSHAIHSSFKPYKQSLHNKIEHVCLFAISIAFVGNLAYQCTANSKDGEAKSKGIVKWFITFIFASAVLMALIGGLIGAKRSYKDYNAIMSGKRAEKKKKEEERLKRKRNAKKAPKPSYRKNAFEKDLVVGGVRRLSKFMPTHMKNNKKHAKFLGLHKPNVGKKTGMAGLLASTKKKTKVQVASV